MKKIFFDMEFTGLHKDTTPISIGLVHEDGPTFYAEFSDFDRRQLNSWLISNVINKLLFKQCLTERRIIGTKEKGYCNSATYLAGTKYEMTEAFGNKSFIHSVLREWIYNQWLQYNKDNEPICFWSDVPAYDWVLLVDTISFDKTAISLPSYVYPYCFDIATIMKVVGIDPDIDREKITGIIEGIKHTALYDAMVIQQAYQRLIKMIK